MRPVISDEVLDRLKKYAASKSKPYYGNQEGKLALKVSEKGQSGWYALTVDDCISMLLKEAGF